MSTPDFAIRVTNLSKVYDLRNQKVDTFRDAVLETAKSLIGKGQKRQEYEFRALKDLSFELKKGEVLGIIGRNGAGKSTLLRILGEITEPTEGTVEINGHVASILDIGTGFHPELSGRENIFLSGSLLGMSQQKIEEKFDTIVEFSGIESFLDVPVKRYSSGMFIRLAFSVVSHLDADIILLDEVLSVGDSEFSVKSFNKIQDLLAEGRSVVIVSHDLNSIANLCTKALILDKGEKKAFGSPMELVGTYLEKTLLSMGNWGDKFAEDAEKMTQQIVWSDSQTAPGNAHVQLRKLSVQALSKSPEADIYMEDDFQVELEFERKDGRPSILSFIFNQQLTEPVMSVTPFRAIAPDAVNESNAPGIYRAVCTFPGKWFNRGLLTLGVIFVSAENKTLFDLPQAISFRIHHVMDPEAKFVYDGNFPGPLFPVVEWGLEKMG